jgi:hypothetical protein
MHRDDPNFDQLRRLLKLKRHEQPPPRYFNDFSSQVVARLQEAQAASAGQSWWQRLWEGLELRPVVPVALGAALCGLLVVGAVYTDKATVPQELLQLTSEDPGKLAGNDTKALLPAMPQADYGFASAANSTNPVPASGTLFDLIQPGGDVPPLRAAHPLFR